MAGFNRNAFGYLKLASFGAPSEFRDSGIAGILDLIKALKWVRANVGEVGGDPGCVNHLWSVWRPGKRFPF